MTCIVGKVDPYACILPPSGARGALYQGSRPRPEWIQALPGPLLVVCLDCDFTAGQWVDGTHCVAALELPQDDRPQDVLSDGVLLGAVESVCAYLRNGVNVLIHCAVGVSRSSYLSLAVLMRLQAWPLAEAETHLRGVWDRAQPNRGFVGHLREMEERLRNG